MSSLLQAKQLVRAHVDQAGDRRREAWNVLRHGDQGPRVQERLWIDPLAVHSAAQWFPFRPAQVVSTWPPAPLMPFEEHPHVHFALARWRDGRPWDQTGSLGHMLGEIARRGQQDGCHDEDEVRERWRRLDALYEQVGRDGRLRTREEVVPGTRRESGGILVHVGPGGEVVAGDSGKHRLTIARLHALPEVPVQLGVVHRSALPLLPALRRPRAQAGPVPPVER